MSKNNITLSTRSAADLSSLAVQQSLRDWQTPCMQNAGNIEVFQIIAISCQSGYILHVQRNRNGADSSCEHGPQSCVTCSEQLDILVVPARMRDRRNNILNPRGVVTHIERQKLRISSHSIGSFLVVCIIGQLRDRAVCHVADARRLCRSRLENIQQ